jgi:hypothetical protein
MPRPGFRLGDLPGFGETRVAVLLEKIIQGGFFLMKKPLEFAAFGIYLLWSRLPGLMPLNERFAARALAFTPEKLEKAPYWRELAPTLQRTLQDIE